MPSLGRVIIDNSGTIIRADQAFQAAVRLDAARLIGRNLLDFTAPADRDRCIQLLDKLVTDSEPVSTVKRLIREDGTHEWICNRLSIGVADTDGLRIAIDVESVAPPRDWIDPAMLLFVAKLLVDGRRARKECFSAPLFADPAWDILLAAYVCEAEGGVLTAADLQDHAGLSDVNAARWMRALNAEGLLEYEQGDGARTSTTFRLSCEAHRKLERFLSDRHRHATALAEAQDIAIRQ
jgi:PAS domain S-box-containing protein